MVPRRGPSTASPRDRSRRKDGLKEIVDIVQALVDTMTASWGELVGNP
jgi:hypothetical protein